MPFDRDIKMKKHVAKCVIKFEKELATKEDVPSLGGGQPYLNLFTPIPILEAEGVIGLNRF